MAFHPTTPFRVENKSIRVTVVAGINIKNTSWVLRQFPYVILTYAGNEYRTSWLTNGGGNPRFNKTFNMDVIDGHSVIHVNAWKKGFLSPDRLIGSSLINLNNALIATYDDVVCPIRDIKGREAGSLQFLLHYPNAQRSPMATQTFQGNSERHSNRHSDVLTTADKFAYNGVPAINPTAPPFQNGH